jgi:AraC family transcriptional regulator
VDSSGRRHERPFSGAHVWIIPPGIRHGVSHQRPSELVIVHPSPRFLAQINRLTPLSAASLLPLERYVREDPFLGELASELWKCFDQEAILDRIALEMAGGLLTRHLLAIHLSPRRRESRSQAGLSAAILTRVVGHMREHLSEELSRDSLARVAGMSPWHFSRMFATSMDCPPMEYLNRLRVERAAALLKTGGKTVLQVALDVGFCDSGQLRVHFKRRYKVSPNAFVPKLRATPAQKPPPTARSAATPSLPCAKNISDPTPSP